MRYLKNLAGQAWSCDGEYVERWVRRLDHVDDAPTRFPDSGFHLDIAQSATGDLVSHDLFFRGENNSGFLHTILDRKSGELYISATRSEGTGQGLGEAMYRKVIASAEAAGYEIKTIVGNQKIDNLDLLREKGLEATPAYRLRVKLGFTRVVQFPTADNDYLLIMGK